MTAHITKAISKVTFWNIKGAFPSFEIKALYFAFSKGTEQILREVISLKHLTERERGHSAKKKKIMYSFSHAVEIKNM